MKKTKIIIGAFIMLSLFGANAFAQEYMFFSPGPSAGRGSFGVTYQNPSKGPIMSAGESIGKGIVKGLTQLKQEQEKNEPAGFILKINPQNIYLGEKFTSDSSAETFKVLLPLELEKSKFYTYTKWTSEGTTFFTEIKFPYMYITVKANNMENIKTVNMKVRSIVNEKAEPSRKDQKIFPQYSFENSESVLRLDYKIGDKEFTKYFGQYKPVAYLRALNHFFSAKPLGEFFNLRDRNNVSVILPDNYELVTSYWHTREYFGFETKIVSSKEGKASSNEKSLLLAFSNSNPVLEKVSAKISEEDGKIYLSYISGDILDKKVHKQLIAIKK